MSDDGDAPLCEFTGCDHGGWVVLHFGPKLTPPLFVACYRHRGADDVTQFTDRRPR